MAVTIGSNISSLSAQRRLSENSDALSRVFERVSSGMRINRASDDAAGISIADSLRADTKIYTQGIRNANDGISLLNIASGALDQLSAIVTRQLELAEQSSNGVYGFAQRKSMNNEANELVEEFNRIIQSTQFNGRALFDQNSGELRLQLGYGVNGSIAFRQNSELSRTIGNGSFTSSSAYASANTQDEVVADINGDGINDLLTVGGSGVASDQVTVWIGNGDGTFKNKATYDTGFAASGNANKFSLGDIDNDGIKDLIVCSTGSGTAELSFLKGTSSGTFQAGQVFNIGAGDLRSVRLGDFNGDNNLDAVTVAQTSGYAQVLYGNGNGTFSMGASIAISNAANVEVGDINGDGRDDFVVVNGSANVFINQDGRFNSYQAYSVGGGGATFLNLGDVNGDGYLDIVTNSTSGNRVLLANSNGTFQANITLSNAATTAGSIFVDLNGDGFLDVVSASTATSAIVSYLGNGDGSFGAGITLGVSISSSNAKIAHGDLNNDGVEDIIWDRVGANEVGFSLQGTTTTTQAARLDLYTQDNAMNALDAIRRTLTRVSAEKGAIGAYQSRIGVAIGNLSTTTLNYQAAESRIRDADIAQETAELTRRSVLQQIGAAILGQANIAPKLALELLKN